MKVNTALILCAGYGKRLLPLTSKKPKPLLELKQTLRLSTSARTFFLILSSNIIDLPYVDQVHLGGHHRQD